LVFSPTYWPDYSEDEYRAAIRRFGQRERRFGLTSEQIK
ncbi:MAG: undecaprenyl diphosphate synthase family protein, partial [Muribaculaceae bacterium]|nr:undecaprenyl diphosphate synthase family protein [Muribaculaceae bacterium]